MNGKAIVSIILVIGAVYGYIKITEVPPGIVEVCNTVIDRTIFVNNPPYGRCHKDNAYRTELITTFSQNISKSQIDLHNSSPTLKPPNGHEFFRIKSASDVSFRTDRADGGNYINKIVVDARIVLTGDSDVMIYGADNIKYPIKASLGKITRAQAGKLIEICRFTDPNGSPQCTGDVYLEIGMDGTTGATISLDLLGYDFRPADYEPLVRQLKDALTAVETPPGKAASPHR